MRNLIFIIWLREQCNCKLFSRSDDANYKIFTLFSEIEMKLLKEFNWKWKEPFSSISQWFSLSLKLRRRWKSSANQNMQISGKWIYAKVIYCRWFVCAYQVWAAHVLYLYIFTSSLWIILFEYLCSSVEYILASASDYYYTYALCS